MPNNKIRVGIDIGTSYSYTGVFEAGVFSHGFSSVSEVIDRGAPSFAVQYNSDAGDAIRFGNVVEELEYRKMIREPAKCKKEILEYIKLVCNFNNRVKEKSRIVELEKVLKDLCTQLLWIIKYMLSCARNTFSDREIESVVVGMPALTGKEEKAYKRLLYKLVKLAAEHVNSFSPELLEAIAKGGDCGTVNRKDFMAEKVLTKSEIISTIKGTVDDKSCVQTGVVVDIFHEPFLGILGRVTDYKSPIDNGVVLCVDIGGGTVDVCAYENADHSKVASWFANLKHKSVPLGATELDDYVKTIKNQIWSTVPYGKLRDIREALAGNPSKNIVQLKDDSGRYIGVKDEVKDSNNQKSEIVCTMHEFWEVEKDAVFSDKSKFYTKINKGGVADKYVGKKGCNPPQGECKNPNGGCGNPKKKCKDPQRSLRSFFEYINEALEKEEKPVDAVYLIGGGSQMNVVRPLVEAVFGVSVGGVGKMLYLFQPSEKTVTPSNAVAYGAAVEASELGTGYKYKVFQAKNYIASSIYLLLNLLVFGLFVGLFLSDRSWHWPEYQAIARQVFIILGIGFLVFATHLSILRIKQPIFSKRVKWWRAFWFQIVPSLAFLAIMIPSLIMIGGFYS